MCLKKHRSFILLDDLPPGPIQHSLMTRSVVHSWQESHKGDSMPFLEYHIRRQAVLIHPTSDDVNFDHLIKFVSSPFPHLIWLAFYGRDILVLCLWYTNLRCIRTQHPLITLACIINCCDYCKMIIYYCDSFYIYSTVDKSHFYFFNGF